MERQPIDIWRMHGMLHPICITTNGTVARDGLVMGRGNALEAKTKYPTLPRRLARMILASGNHVYYLPVLDIFTFPVKHRYDDVADPALIERSARELLALMNSYESEGALKFPLYLPSPGTGNGHLSWEVVEPVLERVFGDDPRIVICVKPGSYEASVSESEVITIGELT